MVITGLFSTAVVIVLRERCGTCFTLQFSLEALQGLLQGGRIYLGACETRLNDEPPISQPVAPMVIVAAGSGLWLNFE